MKMKNIIGVALAAIVAATPACTGAICNVESGTPLWGEMPDLDMLVGDKVREPLEDYFHIIPRCMAAYRDDGIDAFEATSADPTTVAVSIVDYATLEIAALKAADSVRVAVAGYSHGTYGHEFLVRVRPR